MSGSSLKSLMLYAPDDPAAKAEADKAALRAELLKNTVTSTNDDDDKKDDENKDDNDDDDKDDEDDKDDDDKSDDVNENETEEEKVVREAKEAKDATDAKIAAKAQRKQERMQKRIDEAVAEREKYKQQLEDIKAANPDKNLTEAEVEARAEAKAAQKVADKAAADLQAAFEADCDRLQKGARKLDKDFDDNVNDMADQFGPIPSFMIGILADTDNGDEVLAYIAKNEEVAELIYSMKGKPAKMTRELVGISTKLLDAKKKPKKEISKVPDPPTPVNARNVQNTTITSQDTKPENMDNFIAKRRKQQEEYRRNRGGF
jgi:hypothetical protein